MPYIMSYERQKTKPPQRKRNAKRRAGKTGSPKTAQRDRRLCRFRAQRTHAFWRLGSQRPVFGFLNPQSIRNRIKGKFLDFQNMNNYTSKSIYLANKSQLKWLLLGLLFTALLWPQNAQAQSQNVPVLVELFTSAGCPACPPADRNIARLADENPNIIGVSCHVTYFNRGRRTDPLSRPFCDARQNIYKLALKTGGIFTPMTIINGAAYTNGKDMSKTKKPDKQDTKTNISGNRL